MKEYKDNIEALADIDLSGVAKKLKDSKDLESKESWIDDLRFEIDYYWNSWITQPWRTFNKGISNLWKWRKIIWNDRWWDYDFLHTIILFKLKDMESHWGVDTHYVKDYVEKDTLKKLIEDLEWMMDTDHENDFAKDKDGNPVDIREQYTSYNKEYARRAKRFYNRLERHHLKLWD
jgi:hypothetical protein